MLPPDFIIEKHVKQALEEDIGFGDISTDYLAKDTDKLTVYLNTRVDGIVCGLQVFKKVFEILDKNIEITFNFKDGDKIKKGDTLAILKGSARSILTGERTALNYIQRMSGIATHTNKYVEAIKGTSAQIADTRKTTPNFRMFEKYAVKTGGASLHRFNLCDCVMLKDNHIKLAGTITNAVQTIKDNVSHAHKIELECDTKDQVIEALSCGVDIIMLDNMTKEQVAECIKIIDKKALIEVSGNVTLDNLKSLAQSGVDIISTSAIVTKAGTLDLGFDII